MPLDQVVVETASEAVTGRVCPIKQALPALAVVAIVATVVVFAGKTWRKKHPKKLVAQNSTTV